MKRFSSFLQLLGLILFIFCSESRLIAQSGKEPLDLAEEAAYKQAASRVAPSVVRVETVGGLDRVGAVITGTGATTGLIVGKEGWIVTSTFNFSGQPASVVVTLADGKKSAARIVASDRQKMLTLLKIEAQNLPVPTAAPESTWKVGQTAIALGKTYTESAPAISVGIVSALNRVWGKAIQTDAKISPTNYGGPLVDLQGRVLGVLVPLSPTGAEVMAGSEWYDSGIGFCIPFTQIQTVLPRLQKGETLLPGRAGISLNMKLVDQAVIERVDLGSPAYRAGLKAGDKVTGIDGQAVSRESQIRQIFGRKYSGDKLKVTYEREKQRAETELTLLSEFPPYRAPLLGLLLQRAILRDARIGFEIFDVLPESPAAKAGIKAGDRLMSLDGHAYDQPRFVHQDLNLKQPTETVTLVISRGGKNETLKVELGDATSLKIPHPAPRRRVVLPPDSKIPAVKSGVIHAHSEEDNRDYWTYIPEGFTEAEDPSIVIWLHPTGNPREQEILDAWKKSCDERRIVVIAPLLDRVRDWGEQDLEFIAELVQTILLQTGPVNRARISIHGQGSGATAALLMAEKYPELAQGICLIDPVRISAVLPHDPERPFQFLLIGSQGKPNPSLNLLDKKLQEMMYPMIRREMPGSLIYPNGDLFQDVVSWVDSLDRI